MRTNIEIDDGLMAEALRATGETTKRAVVESLGHDFEPALAEVEDLYRYQLMSTEDAAEGLRAFMEKRKPVWKDR